MPQGNNTHEMRRHWTKIPALSITRCAVDQVTVMLNVTLEGGPARFRVVIDDVAEASMMPASARFDRGSSEQV